MRDAAGLRVWALLARVRQLRVERARRRLGDARAGAQRAAEATAQQRDAIARHRALRGDILAACSGGAPGASLWRAALRRHDAGSVALDAALAVASDAEHKARQRVVAALHALQKETRGLDDARARLRRLVAEERDDHDSDD